MEDADKYYKFYWQTAKKVYNSNWYVKDLPKAIFRKPAFGRFFLYTFENFDEFGINIRDIYSGLNF